MPGLHQQEQHYRLVLVSRPPLAHAERVVHPVCEPPLYHRVDFRRAKAHPGRIQHAIGAAQERDVSRDRVDDTEIAVPVVDGRVSAFVFFTMWSPRQLKTREFSLTPRHDRID